MKKLVIIGAGPIGLYLACQLQKIGIKNIVIYDPRANSYVRPGYINPNVLSFLKTEFNTQFSDIKTESTKDALRFLFNPTGHIKDVERFLFNKAVQLEILIEKKKFVRFHVHEQCKGIIIQDAKGVEEFIECDVVFDCTGSQRSLINEINRIVPEQPFTLKQIHKDIITKKHIIAYGRMDEAALSKINAIQSIPHRYYVSGNYLQNIEKLRQLGWREFGAPFTYGIDFGKGKICLYTECPDSLSPQSHGLWIKTLIEGITDSPDYTFRELSPSRKYAYKPRFVAFSVVPMELEQTTYRSENLPMIIPMGDAQIDAYYVLGHGMIDGFKRVKSFLECITINNGLITCFDDEKYKAAIESDLSSHKAAIIERFIGRRNALNMALMRAEVVYKYAVLAAKEQSEKSTLDATLKEINARIAYLNANKLLHTLTEQNGGISLIKNTSNDLITTLKKLSELLIAAYTELPLFFITEREEAFKNLNHVVASLKVCAEEQVRKDQFQGAISTYQILLTLYQHPTVYEIYQTEIIRIETNIIACTQKLSDEDKKSTDCQTRMAVSENTSSFFCAVNVVPSAISNTTDQLQQSKKRTRETQNAEVTALTQ